MATNHFNERLLQTLKEIGLRLDRVEGRLERVDDRLDRVIEQKADKADLDALRTEMRAQTERLESEFRSPGERLDSAIRSRGQQLARIETGIRTLQWTMSAGLAVMGIIFAFLRAC